MTGAQIFLWQQLWAEGCAGKNGGVGCFFAGEGISHEVCWIDSVIQEAHIGIDENGIEAASFTQMDWAGAALPSGRAEMILDRPFLYVVQEKGCPLFIGICENPADGE